MRAAGLLWFRPAARDDWRRGCRRGRPDSGGSRSAARPGSRGHSAGGAGGRRVTRTFRHPHALRRTVARTCRPGTSRRPALTIAPVRQRDRVRPDIARLHEARRTPLGSSRGSGSSNGHRSTGVPAPTVAHRGGLPRPYVHWVGQDVATRTASWLDLAWPALMFGIEYEGVPPRTRRPRFVCPTVSTVSPPAGAWKQARAAARAGAGAWQEMESKYVPRSERVAPELGVTRRLPARTTACHRHAPAGRRARSRRCPVLGPVGGLVVLVGPEAEPFRVVVPPDLDPAHCLPQRLDR